MKKIERYKKKLNNFLFDHFILKEVLYNAEGFLIGTLAAIIFAFGFVCFVTPSQSAVDPFTIVTGGISGLSQDLTLVLKIFGLELGKNTIQSIGYFAFNIPICIFAFFCIGKRFSIQTIINVGETSLFIFIFSNAFGDSIASHPLIANSILSRVLLAALCTGISSAIAFKGEISCGGIDVFSYYFALRKSTTVGKYAVIFNAIIVSAYACLLVGDGKSFADCIVSLLYSVIYLFVVSVVVDMINVRNKKMQIQIITSKENMAQILIANFPHGATISKGKGAYSGSDRNVIWIVVSSSEVKRVINVARKVDQHAFIGVTSLVQVYGNFFIKPVQ